MFTGLTILLVAATFSGPTGALLLHCAEKVREYLHYQDARRLSDYCDAHNRRSLYLSRLALYCVASSSAFIAPTLHPDGLCPEEQEERQESARSIIGADIEAEYLQNEQVSSALSPIPVQTRSGIRYRNPLNGRFCKANATF